MEEESELQPVVVACAVANEEGESEDDYEEEKEGGGGSESESEEEEEEKEEEESRRKRKRPSDAIVPVDELPAPVQKNQQFTRIWSVEDEITLLECMHKEGFERNSVELYEIIKKRLEWNVQRNQLTDKICRLRKKYFKMKNQVMDGEEPPDTAMGFYRLADNVWGEQHKADEKVKGKGKLVRKNNVEEEEEEEETDDDTKTKKTKFMSKKVMMERSEKHVQSLYEDWERVEKVRKRMEKKYLK